MKKLTVLLLAGVMCASMLTGCGKKEEPVEASPEVSEVSEEEVEEPVDTHPGLKQNELTGEWIDEELAAQRPVSIMVSNSSGAVPQYGIVDADFVIEAPMEGGETRFIAYYKDYPALEKVMSVRSARHYFIYWANEFDSIYAHFGYSIYAQDILDAAYMDNLNGLYMDGTYYFRDPEKSNPHDAYVTGDSLVAAIESKGYRTKHNDDWDNNYYKFVEEADDHVDMSAGEDCEVFKPGYYISKPSYVYNKEDGLYYRYQYEGPMMDANNGMQEAVKNIIYVKTVNAGVLEDSKDHGYLDIVNIGEGEGLYITEGKAIPCKWQKADEYAHTLFFDMDGNPLVMNQGKTWVCVCDDQYTGTMGMWATFEEYEASK